MIRFAPERSAGARAAAALDQGLSGRRHVLPLRARIAPHLLQSSRWFLRAERCYLPPGDSPLGCVCH
jgi:hypothetical protein